MNEQQFNWYNNITGWLIFAVAVFTYFSTMEPTTSLWDCGEFIAASYKLQVVHPPGAPFFLLLNRFFTILAPASDPTWVPKLVNGSSALASAFTILFLFWTITALSRKIVIKNLETFTFPQLIAVLGSGAVGALAFTFSDTFWFSAVEGEVYALSTFFMAIVFWLMLKWEKRADHPHSYRWLVLIFYLIGLSIGVHLLSLLVIPSLAFIYYFRKYKPTWTGGIIAGIIGVVILGVLNTGIIRWLPFIASRFELVFVNNFGMPFWSGIFFFLILLVAAMIFGIYWTHKNGKVIINLILVSFTVILISYSSYAMVVIRSLANPPIDMNDPETVFNLISYLNREQYGDRPFVYGPYYTAALVDFKEDGKQWEKGEEKYLHRGFKQIPIYDEENQTIFPRMGDTRGDRVRFYRSYEDLKKNEKPKFKNNIHFFFTYQLGHMYWRYFAWNFIGRQNGEQGFGYHGEFNSGNWMSGIGFLDKALANVGPQENLPSSLKDDKARNFLYFLPFLFGILGLIFHYLRDEKGAFYTFVFFFMTGIGLVLYLNNPPLEPRERDYTLVGSFYVFAIWVGMGVLMIRELLLKTLKEPLSAVIATALGLIAVPAVMAAAEWDDHDRSDNFMSRDIAVNYLQSCDSNAVLFTNGDNETYPVWYAQEVEGIRTDVRSVNLSLLNTDWYANILRKDVNNSEGLAFTLGPEKITQGTRDYVVFQAAQNLDKNKYYDLRQIIDFIASDDPRTRVRTQGGDMLDIYPTKKFFLPVDKQKVIDKGIVSKEYHDRIVDRIEINYDKNTMYKADLLVLDLVAQNEWHRPICFAITSGEDAFAGLQDYFQMDGMVYKFVPIRDELDYDQQVGFVDTEKMYDNMMNKFRWGNIDKEEVFIGSVMMRQCQNYRNVFNRLIIALIAEGKNDKAEKVLDKAFEVLPRENVPYDYMILPLIEGYYKINKPEKAFVYAEQLADIAMDHLKYYLKLEPSFQKTIESDMSRYFYTLQTLERFARQNGQQEFEKRIKEDLKFLEGMYQSSAGIR